MGVLNVELYEQQFDFVTALEHYVAFVGGIGSGKTVSGCARGLAASFGNIGETRVRTPNLGIITAPTYTMLQDITVRTFLDIAGGLVKDYNKNEHRALMRNGSEVLFRSTEHPDRLRGPSVTWWYGDEAALYQPKVWPIMIGRTRQYGQHGWAWLGTTPKGRDYIWQRFVQAQRKNYRLIRARTWDNPFNHPDYVAGLLEEYSGDFARQELEGEFVAFEGLIYPEFSRDTHIRSDRPQTFKEVVAGVDWGFSHPGVIVVYGLDYDLRMWGLKERHKLQRRIEECVNVAVQLLDTYGVNKFFCDPSEPNYIKAFTNAGLKAEGADNDVHAGVQAVKKRYVVREDGLPRLIYPSDWVWSISEREQYQWKTNKDSSFSDDPLKANDHTCDAERYVVMGVDGRVKKGEVVTETQRYA